MLWTKDSLVVDTDFSRLDFELVHGFLTHSYWSPGITREAVELAAKNSVCFGLYDGAAQVGYARVITDRVSFGYLADVFLLESHRGRGHAQWFMECVLGYPEFETFRRWMLVTRDAHSLYRKVGFQELDDPSRYMVRPGTAAALHNPPKPLHSK
jgi:GNAT superfamily N-acetyltransferase